MFNNIINKAFTKHKVQIFGLNNKFIIHSAQKFGLPQSVIKSDFFGSSINKCTDFEFIVLKSVQNLTNLVLTNPSLFNLPLRRLLSKRIRFLKLNRSLRGVRHVQSLPVRGQRSKTNAQTQKAKRR